MWDKKGKCAVTIGFDFDAETLWTCKGLETASPISRGKYGAYVGMPRILKFLEDRNIKVTFFIPGWVAKHYREIVEETASLGHEIAHHGWLHHDPNGISIEQEKDEFERGLEVFNDLNIKTVGYRSPAFDLGPNTLNLLKEHNYIYDTSMMAHEKPYLIKDKGIDTNIVELPVSWELDDAPYYLFSLKPSYRKGLSDPEAVLNVWKTEFSVAYKESGFYLLTLHPQITGRGYRLDVLSRLLDYIQQYPEVWITTHAEVAKQYQKLPDNKKIFIDIGMGLDGKAELK